jgi:hypothetical protein
VLDWGCGSGVAGRRFVRFFGAASFKTLLVFDQSPLAAEFAAGAARKAFPGLSIETAEVQPNAHDHSPSIVVISHVLNELSKDAAESLRLLVKRAAAVVWVEAGTREVSRNLIAWREALRDGFEVIAPCTHQAPCGMLAAENGRHWCHHFAAPPAGIMADSNWVRFGQRAGIDLRSLPYSFLVMERRGVRTGPTDRRPEGLSRIIGEPRFYKGFARIFSCQEAGVRELRLQKRSAPELFRAMKDGTADPIHRWSLRGNDIEPDPPNPLNSKTQK